MPKPPKKGHKSKPKGRKPPQKRIDDSEDRNEIVISNPKARLEPRKKGNGDSGNLLRDPKRLAEDIKLVEQSIKKGWNVKRKNMLVNRLYNIVGKTTGDMSTKDGIVESETVADKLAIDAAKVLVAMDAQDVARVKANQPDTPSTVVNNTNVLNVLNNNGFDDRTVELARLANKLGARELTISGRAVPIQDILGAVDRIPAEERSLPNQKPSADNASS